MRVYFTAVIFTIFHLLWVGTHSCFLESFILALNKPYIMLNENFLFYTNYSFLFARIHVATSTKAT